MTAASLEEWLIAWPKTAYYKRLHTEFSKQASMTPVDETVFIYGLIQYVRPALCLEIGSFFAATTRIMAAAIADAAMAATLVTLDPYGEKRVPKIIAKWPKNLRRVTDYRPISSMNYFMELEDQNTKKGAYSPLGLVFVDGNHSFDYALFDIFRSADFLRPGGAIVVDNLEQAGPSHAVKHFLHLNPAWKCFFKGNVYNSQTLPDDIFSLSADEVLWCVLIAPSSLQIARQVVKLASRLPAYAPLKHIRFNIAGAHGEGVLRANIVYYALPYDFHVTGTGVVRNRKQYNFSVMAGDSALTFDFNPAMALSCVRQDIHICYQLELTFEGAGYLMLNPEIPISLLAG